MKIGVACGGTGGHIFPGLATAETLRRRGHAVTLWLAGKDVENTVLAGWPGAVVTVRTRSFYSRLSPRNLAVLLQLGRALMECRRNMRRNAPDVLLAMGSYASLAPVLAARGLGIPVVLHEANVVPGRAVRFLVRRVQAVAIGFEETRALLRHPRLVLTGMPLYQRPAACPTEPALSGRSRVKDSPGASEQEGEQPGQPSNGWKLAPDRFTVLVMGGSRGAHRLNELASAALVRLQAQGRPVQAIHLTGAADETAVRQAYERAGVVHQVFGFLRDMESAYRRADLAVCRAGAATCAELALYGLPALLVPYPFAVNQHQLANARAVERSGAADVMAEAELTPAKLAAYLERALTDSERLKKMGAASRSRVAGDAAATLADLVERVAGK